MNLLQRKTKTWKIQTQISFNLIKRSFKDLCRKSRIFKGLFRSYLNLT